ncbi:MAG: cysteine peptidase family C39 domain-containing protein [Candidatus Omnitrophica bacterium]|nr:cysteine peptidase family C39 domain-containing protein [Candidatus Omnitrophota bacterium]
MLDWQNKKWIKVIAVILVITFISYDIAWAVDFSPIPLFKTTPNFIPKITDFISSHIFKKTQKNQKPQETELSFRSQLIPSKKYEEDSGFQRLDTVKEMMKRQLEDMQRRQAIENDRSRNIYNQYQINKSIYLQEQQKGQGVQEIQDQLNKARGATINAAAAGGEFSYTLNKDGSRVNYTDGLPSSIENEPITDSYGYKSIKNTKNMRYNNDRLMTSYDAEVIDALGNVTKIQWRNATYSPDSVWWADPGTSAGKYLLGYAETVTDPYGTTNMREWSATRDAYNDAKKITSYREILKDALGNITSISDLSGAIYDGDNMTGYHQVVRDSYGNLYTTDWSSKFNKANRIISVTSKDKQENLDFSTSLSETTTTYEYDSEDKLKSAVGKTKVKGDDGFLNTYSGSTDHVYEIINGQLKLKRNVTETAYDNADGSFNNTAGIVEYSYDGTGLLSGARGFTQGEGEDVFGSTTRSATLDEYEIIASQARRAVSTTSNDSDDIFGSTTHSETYTEYSYNDLGELIDAQGYTDTTGMDVFGSEFGTHTVHEYAIINGQARVVRSDTGGNLVNPFSDLGEAISDLEAKLNSFISMAEPEKKSFLQGIGLGNTVIASITSAGINTIVNWLSKATTKVINCAVTSLLNILSELGIKTTKEELAHAALLVDILTGVITPENAKGELQLSMFSIIKTAEAKGVVLKGAHLTFDQLKSSGQSVIAYVDTNGDGTGDHYVVVTEMTDAGVKYIDNNVEVTKTREEFTAMWSGDVLMFTVPQGAEISDIARLNAIRGANTQSDTPRPSNPPDDFQRLPTVTNAQPGTTNYVTPPVSDCDPSHANYNGAWGPLLYSFADTSDWIWIDDKKDSSGRVTEPGHWQWTYIQIRTWTATSTDGNGSYSYSTTFNRWTHADGVSITVTSSQSESWALDTDGDGRIDVRRSTATGSGPTGSADSTFIVENWGNNGRHVEIMGPDGGFILYREGSDTRDSAGNRTGSSRNVYYYTKGKDSESTTVLESHGAMQNIWVDSKNTKGSSSIVAEKKVGEKGVRWADYFAENKDTDREKNPMGPSITLARIERILGRDAYNITGLNWFFQGLSTSYIYINDREIGQPVPLEKKTMNITRNDFKGINGFPINDEHYDKELVDKFNQKVDLYKRFDNTDSFTLADFGMEKYFRFEIKEALTRNTLPVNTAGADGDAYDNNSYGWKKENKIIFDNIAKVFSDVNDAEKAKIEIYLNKDATEDELGWREVYFEVPVINKSRNLKKIARGKMRFINTYLNNVKPKLTWDPKKKTWTVKWDVIRKENRTKRIRFPIDDKNYYSPAAEKGHLQYWVAGGYTWQNYKTVTKYAGPGPDGIQGTGDDVNSEYLEEDGTVTTTGHFQAREDPNSWEDLTGHTKDGLTIPHQIRFQEEDWSWGYLRWITVTADQYDTQDSYAEDDYRVWIDLAKAWEQHSWWVEEYTEEVETGEWRNTWEGWVFVVTGHDHITIPAHWEYGPKTYTGEEYEGLESLLPTASPCHSDRDCSAGWDIIEWHYQRRIHTPWRDDMIIYADTPNSVTIQVTSGLTNAGPGEDGKSTEINREGEFSNLYQPIDKIAELAISLLAEKDSKDLWEKAQKAGAIKFQQTLDLGVIRDNLTSSIYTPSITRVYNLTNKLGTFALNNISTHNLTVDKMLDVYTEDADKKSAIPGTISPAVSPINPDGTIITIAKEGSLGPSFNNKASWHGVGEPPEPVSASPTGTFTSDYMPPFVIHEDVFGNIYSILKAQPDGQMRFFEFSHMEGNDRIFTPEIKEEQGQVRITTKPDGRKVLITTDRDGREIAVTLENERAYVERGGINIPVYFESSLNEDGTKSYVIDLNTRIPTFERMTLKEAKNVVQKVKDMLLKNMANIGSLLNINEAAKNSILTVKGIQTVANWLNRMGVYVLNCAVTSLYRLMKKYGLSVNMEDIAAKAVVYDLMNGIITPESKEILYTSFSALEESSKELGLGLKRYMTTIEGLRNISNPVIAHVGGDHAVLVLGANEKEVIVVETDGKTCPYRSLSF